MRLRHFSRRRPHRPELLPEPPAIDERFTSRLDRSLWRVVQTVVDSQGYWVAALVPESDTWRPLRGSGLTWTHDEGADVLIIRADRAHHYEREQGELA